MVHGEWVEESGTGKASLSEKKILCSTACLSKTAGMEKKVAKKVSLSE